MWEIDWGAGWLLGGCCFAGRTLFLSTAGRGPLQGRPVRLRLRQHLPASSPPWRLHLSFCSLQQHGDLLARLRGCASWQELRALLTGLEASGKLQQLAASLLPEAAAAAVRERGKAHPAAAGAAAAQRPSRAAAEATHQPQPQQAKQQQAARLGLTQREHLRFVGIISKQGSVCAAAYMPLNSAGRLSGAHLQLVLLSPSLRPVAGRRGLLPTNSCSAFLARRCANASSYCQHCQCCLVPFTLVPDSLPPSSHH